MMPSNLSLTVAPIGLRSRPPHETGKTQLMHLPTATLQSHHRPGFRLRGRGCIVPILVAD